MARADPFVSRAGHCHLEQRWREPAARDLQDGRAGKVLVGRWIGTGSAGQFHRAEPAGGYHVLELNLRPAEMSVRVGDTLVHDGKLAAGSALLTRAGSSVVARYEGSFDLLHLFLPNRPFQALLDEFEMPGVDEASTYTCPDPIMTRLASSLLAADDLETAGAELYFESLTRAILARAIGHYTSRRGSCHPPRRGLVKWRQRRVAAFVDANLSETIRLQDMAQAAGLSRMHFAAQFRAATGVRPHDYVVSRRIERAQDLLRDTRLPLVEVALSVGFQTQAHFTTVFREQVQETPGRWRQLHGTS